MLWGLAAMEWMVRLAGAALLQQSLELWLLRRRLGARGIWRWSILRDEVAGAPALLRRRVSRSPACR